jgi:hypothetical protein
MVGTGSTLFPGRLFWRQLRFGGNWLHNIFQKIVLEAGQIWRELATHFFWRIVLKIWRELAPHFFPEDCFRGSSDLAGTGSTLFSGGWFWRQLKFGGNWLHIIFQQIVFGGSSHYIPTDCFGGSSNLEGTGSMLFSGILFWKFGGT